GTGAAVIGTTSGPLRHWVRELPVHSPGSPSSVKDLPATRPNFGLRNCMKVACIRAVVGALGAGSSAAVLTGLMAPESCSTLSPKPLLAMSLRKPPGHRPALPVSTLSVYSALPQN